MKDDQLISVVIPVYNEEKNVKRLFDELLLSLNGMAKKFEIIFVDDGSTDQTIAELKKLRPARIISFAKNFGQTAAFNAGFQAAKGDIIATIDGDLENDPRDIEKLLEKLDEGFDVVSGWRKSRWKDKVLTRRIPSWAANRLISFITGVKLHDHGCSLKVYRGKVLKGVNLGGDMHRMLAAYIASRGARIAEVAVSYRSRQYGKSKYGLSRTFKVLLDIVSFYFFDRYARRPMHFFGGAGFVSLISGGFIFLWALFLRIFEGTHLNRTPLPVLTAILVVIGFQFILMGLLAEIIVRSSKDFRDQEAYKIKEEIDNR